MQQQHGFVKAAPTATCPLLLGHLLLLLFADGVIVLVEEQLLRSFVTRIVGHEKIGAVSEEQALAIEGVELLIDGSDMAVVPFFQQLRLGVAGQFAQKVLIARRRAGIEIAVVEAGALQGHVARRWIDLTPGHLGAQGID